MKDTYKIWRRLLQRSYSAVNTSSLPSNKVYNRTCQEEFEEEEEYSRNRSENKYRTSISFGLIGLIAIALGMLVLFIHPYDIIFKMKVLLSDGGEVFNMWKDPPVDIYLRVHLFNITNAEEFLSGKEKLKMKEIGPYVYREVMSHQNVSFNSNGTLSASPSHPLEWVPELSVGDHENDQMMLPNIALLSIADVFAEKPFFTKMALNLLIRQTQTQPIVKMSPKEFMFGYSSTLMTMGYSLLPSWIDFEKLGLIDRMYNFKGDFETVYTGENDISQSGLLETYRGSTHLPQWEGYCGSIQNASDGTKFRGGVTPNDTQIFYRKSLCRAKPMVWVNSTVSSGLNGYVYKFPKNANDNGKYDPKNKCFCKTEKCMPSGLLDVRECYYGFPIALSYPHFLDADPSLSEMVDGMEPDRREHESYFVVQPESGLPLDLAVRYQINLALRDVDDIAYVKRFSNLVVPMLWTENRLYTIPPQLAKKFHVYLDILPLLETAAIYILFILGVIFVLVSLRNYRKLTRQLSSNVKWISEETGMRTTDRKLSIYVPETRRRMSNKDMELYFSSLVAPLNQQLEPIDLHEPCIVLDDSDED